MDGAGDVAYYVPLLQITDVYGYECVSFRGDAFGCRMFVSGWSSGQKNPGERAYHSPRHGDQEREAVRSVLRQVVGLAVTTVAGILQRQRFHKVLDGDHAAIAVHELCHARVPTAEHQVLVIERVTLVIEA